MLNLTASIYRVTMDKEGETTLVLKIPKTDLPKAAQLLALTETALSVSVEVQHE